MGRLKGVGRVMFAAPLVVFAVQHFLYALFISTLVPAWMPGRLFLAYFTGAAFLAAAAAILAGRPARLAGGLLGAMFLVFVLTTHIPRIAKSPADASEWTSGFVALAMCGAAWMVAASFRVKPEGAPDRLFLAGRVLFGVAMAAFGVQHLVFVKTAGGIGPPWFPPGMVLAALTGTALFLLGLAALGENWTRISGVGLGAVLLLDLSAVLVPKLLAGLHDPGPWTGAAEMLALGGAALVLAGATARAGE